MKKIVWFFPVWFLIDNIMGLNGYHFTIFGVGIRNILFVLSVLSLGFYCFYIIKKQSISLFRREKEKTHILDYSKWIDWFVLGFLVWNGIWATVVPVLSGSSLSYALHDFLPMLTLVLYFPCAFLIRTKHLNVQAFYKLFYSLLLLLGVWHCVMYIGEVLAPGFYMGYYDLIDRISFGTAVRTDVILGFGITRIIQTTSVLLMPAMFLTLERGAHKVNITTLAALALTLFAVLITYTKSIWFGVLAGLIVAIVGILIFSRNAHVKKRLGIFSMALVLFFCMFNFGFLKNTIITRTLNSVNTNAAAEIDAQIKDLQDQLDKIQSGTNDPNQEQDAEKLEQLLKEMENRKQDAAGTAEANAKRAEQNRALIGKWSKSLLFGYGYGAYAEDCIRSEQFPYMYESLVPALLMKLGVAGAFGWVVFIVALLVFALKTMRNKVINLFCWAGTALSCAMAVQTNPLLFTIPGMTLILYLLLYATGIGEEAE